MLGVIALLLVLWLVITVIGAVVHGLFILAVIGGILFLATAAFGWARRNLGSGDRRSLR
jgi:hypothetical protein